MENDKIIDVAIKGNHPLLLIGHTGVGKTTMLSEKAKKKKKRLHRISVNDQIGREDLIGKFVLKDGETVWQDGILVHAMKKGDWIVLDEINSARPELLFALHAILDDERALVIQENENERVPAHKSFRLFVTMNPTSYHGTKEMNQAFMSRFVVVNIEPMNEREEAKLFKDMIPDEELNYILSVAKDLRRKHRDDDIDYFCSTRDVRMAIELTKSGLPNKQAVRYSFFNKMNEIDREFIGQDTRDVFIDDYAAIEKKYHQMLYELKECEHIEERLNNGKVALREAQNKHKLKMDEIAHAEKELEKIKNATEKEKEKIGIEYIKNLTV